MKVARPIAERRVRLVESMVAEMLAMGVGETREVRIIDRCFVTVTRADAKLWVQNGRLFTDPSGIAWQWI